jgi:hypothetical protein
MGHFGFLLPLTVASIFHIYLTPGDGMGRNTEGFCFTPVLKLKGKLDKVFIRPFYVDWHSDGKLV